MALEMAETARPQLGNRAALVLFVLLLLAYVVQTQITQYVQTDLEYRQPFFLFFLTHASFIFILPLHLLLLKLTSPLPIHQTLSALRSAVLAAHSDPRFPLSDDDDVEEDAKRRRRRAYGRFARLMFFLTLGVSAPSLLWYMAVSLTSISSVTALFNTNAFWTYLLSLLLLGDRFRPVRLAAVVLAVVGVVVDAYAGACTPEAQPLAGQLGGETGEVGREGPESPLLGNGLAFLASLASSTFQVLYKKYATSPSSLTPSTSSSSTGSGSGALYAPIPSEPSLSPRHPPTSLPDPASATRVYPDQAVEDGEPLPLPPQSKELPFALYANLITSSLGLGTLLVMWIPIPLLHVWGWEESKLPGEWRTAGLIVLIAVCGVVFNTIFMILITLWGPIVTSVGSLLTTILVLLVDVTLGGCVTLGSWAGCTLIACAFGVLAVDVGRERP